MKQFIRFSIVGVLNTVIGYALIFFFMLVLGWSPEFSNIAGYTICLVSAYSMHRYYAFQSNGGRFKEFGRFISVFLIAYSLNFIALRELISLNWLSPVLAQVGAGAVYVAASFTLYKLIVFIKKPPDLEGG